MNRLCSAYFSASGSWRAPAGVTKVLVLAHGGGAGGSGGYNSTFSVGQGGFGTIPYFVWLIVVPNTLYTITIGGGGSGGAPKTSTLNNGGSGGNTTFGALYTWTGATTSLATPYNGKVFQIPADKASVGKFFSGYGIADTSVSSGTTASFYQGGCVGSPGYTGSVPGNGGNGNAAGTGANGTSATGFGAGGGGAGAGSSGGGTGGAGGPGQMWIMWVE